MLERVLAQKGVEKGQFEAWVQEELRSFFRQLAEKAQDLPEQIVVPIRCFTQHEIGNVAAVAKYLQETKALDIQQIAELLKRDPKSIHASLAKAKQVRIDWESAFFVPINVLTDPALSMLEGVVEYLRKDKGYKPFQIASLLDRDQRVIAVLWQRIKEKREVRHE